MKIQNYFFCSFAIIALALISCENESESDPEYYSEYLSLEISSINNNVEDTMYQIQVFNSQNKEFEKECNLIFSLTDESLENAYTAEENIVNKIIPDDPSLGYLNLQEGGQYTVVSNLNQMDWSGFKLNDIESGNYNLQVTLFIDDPSSPYNLIHSNKLAFTKN